jgi:diaminopimelate epimerase
MVLHFYKYQATGNDFIIIDENENSIPATNTELIKYLCDRHFGIGADGLMIYRNHSDSDFEMLYFNSDGNVATLCGNGGRCITAFAFDKHYIKKKCKFLAADGVHYSEVIEPNLINLKMLDVTYIKKHEDGYEINTGSPHFIIQTCHHINDVDVFKKGKEIRYQKRFGQNGINVNFVQIIDEKTIAIRTYERGVEAETMSCGTGSVASAIYTKLTSKDGAYSINVKTLGGNLIVRFDKKENFFYNVFLIGEAKKVFEGNIKI